jgi:hypothetical protein
MALVWADNSINNLQQCCWDEKVKFTDDVLRELAVNLQVNNFRQALLHLFLGFISHVTVAIASGRCG